MAVVTVKSAAITNRDASPVVLTASAHAAKQVAKGAVTLTSGNDIASKYVVCEIPSNAIIHRVLLNTPAITTAVADVGLYRTTRDGGAVVDVDFFASAQALTSALADTNIMYENAVITIANAGTRVWQILALTSDPSLMYDVVMTLTAAAGATAVASLEVEYSQ